MLVPSTAVDECFCLSTSFERNGLEVSAVPHYHFEAKLVEAGHVVELLWDLEIVDQVVST